MKIPLQGGEKSTFLRYFMDEGLGYFIKYLRKKSKKLKIPENVWTKFSPNFDELLKETLSENLICAN